MSAAHGTKSRYNAGCRCPACTGANRAYCAGLRARHAAWPAAAVPHGTVNGYDNYMCRCDPCTDAKTAWQRGYRARVRAKAAAT